MPTKTENLIQKLAQEAGTQRAIDSHSTGRILLLASALSIVVAIAMVVVLIGIRTDLIDVAHRASLSFKIASTLLLACGGFIFVKWTAEPSTSAPPYIALLPGAGLLALGAVTDKSGLSILGASNISVPACVGAILMLSLPALFFILGALKTGAPTRPSIAGAAAGLLSGTLGAAAYVLACKNDGGLFVAVWYGAAILMMTGLGAVVGRRALAW